MLIFILLTPLLINAITKFVPFNSPDYQFVNAKKSAMESLLVIAAEVMISIIYILLIKHYVQYISAYLIVWQSAFYVLLTAIVIGVVLHRKESLQSIGITRINLCKSSILGAFLGTIFYVLYRSFLETGEAINIFTYTSLISFIQFIFVGVAEEIIFRGYFQTRLIAWLGITKGCLITAVVFTFYHLPVNLFFKGLDLQSALINCLKIIPLSLLLGYIMIKTKNITTVAILHIVIDWTIN